MEITVANKIIVKNPTENIKKWCTSNLVLDNPDYYKKVQMGKWVGNTPRTISLYEVAGNELRLPFGCLQDLWKMVGHSVKWSVLFEPIRQVLYQSNINLYDYQKDAVQAILGTKNGILAMPCGSGKTQCGIEAIARIGGRALWLTHTQELLNQSKSRAESVLDGLKKGMLGTITGGKVNIGTHITFATIQTMCNIDLEQYRDFWDIIVVDECQRCAGSPTKVTQFYKVLSNLSARYKIGLTATPHRADGLEKSMFALLGGIAHEVSRECVKDKTCEVVVNQIFTNWYPADEDILCGDGTIDYHKVVESMVNDKDRFECVLSNIPIGQPTLVLANRVAYLQRLCDGYNGKAICISGAGQSKKAKEERRKALARLNAGEVDCVFATYSLAKEGLDVPNLRYVVFATPEKDSTTVIQSVGRVGRKADGKEYGTVIDFVDNFGMYQGWAKKRVGFYKKIDIKKIF